MKPTTLLLAASLLASSMTFAQDVPAPTARISETAPDESVSPPPGIESALIAPDLATDEPLALKVFLDLVAESITPKPSIAYKPGSEKAVVPEMRVGGVRFGDLLNALEQLVDIQFTIINPSAGPGEVPLVVVETTSKPHPPQGWLGRANDYGTGSSARPAVRGAGSTAGPSPVGSPAAGGGGKPHAKLAPFAGSLNPPSGSPRTGTANIQSAETVEQPHPQTLEFTWDPTQAMLAGHQEPTTKSYAIGALVDESEAGYPVEQVIEAINLVWSTAQDNDAAASKGSRISLHEPSSLLIVKARPELQTLADEVIQNLEIAREQRQKAQTKRTRVQREEIHRQYDEAVNELKARHSREIDDLRKTVVGLEAQLRVLKEKASEIGN